MNIHKEGIRLLREGIILPHYRILSHFLSEILFDSCRILDINCHNGSILESIRLLCNKKVDYTGISNNKDDIEEASKKYSNAVFKYIDYNKINLKTKSFDVVIVQDQFICSSDIVDKIDNLFRISKKWIIFFNFFVLPEYNGVKKVILNGKNQEVFGISYFREIVSIMEPTQLQYSLIFNTNNPAEPTPSIFVMKV